MNPGRTVRSGLFPGEIQMTINPITAACLAIADSASTVPQAAPRRVSGANIVVAPFTPIPAVPKSKPVSAQTSSGGWPSSAETLAAIKAAIDEFGKDEKTDVRAQLLIVACIEHGIDAGTHIRQIGMDLGFNGQHSGMLLHADGAPWQKGPYGRYKLL
jgi:hypothetical protein